MIDESKAIIDHEHLDKRGRALSSSFILLDLSTMSVATLAVVHGVGVHLASSHKYSSHTKIRNSRSDSMPDGKVVKFFKAIDSKFRKSAFGKRVIAPYEGFGSGGINSPSPVASPFKFYESLKWGNKNRAGSKKTSAKGLAIRARIINGPELNILMLGVPFLIDFGVSEATKAARAAKQKKAAKASRKNQPIRVTPKPVFISKFKKVDVPPLPSSPFSGEAHKSVYLALYNLGMSLEGATMVASGEFEGEEASDYLSAEDLEILGNFLTSDDLVNYDLEAVN